MKTPKQVKEWIRMQKWYPAFENIVIGSKNEDDAEKTLDGGKGRDTILSAFCWDETPQGVDFWKKADTQFKKWYDMKSAEQIAEWLQEQEWLPLFIDNMNNRREYRVSPLPKADVILSGKRGKDTIDEAFIWRESPQGFAFWGEINVAFQRWVQSPEV